MAFKKDNIVIFSIVLSTLASAGDLYFNFTKTITADLTKKEIYLIMAILVFTSFILFLIYKLFFRDISELKRKVFKYIIIIPLSFTLIFSAGVIFKTYKLEGRLKMNAKLRGVSQINLPTSYSQEQLDKMVTIALINKLSPEQLLQYKKLELEIMKAKKSTDSKQEEEDVVDKKLLSN